MDKTNTNIDFQLTEMTQTASLTEFTQTVTPQIAETQTVTNLTEDLPQNISSTGNWQPRHQLKDGKYTIEKELGKGGFGITYLATNQQGKTRRDKNAQG